MRLANEVELRSQRVVYLYLIDESDERLPEDIAFFSGILSRLSGITEKFIKR